MNAIRRLNLATQAMVLLAALPVADAQIADDAQLRQISPPGDPIQHRNQDELALFNDVNGEFEQRVKFDIAMKFASKASRVIALYNPGRFISPRNANIGSSLAGSNVTRAPAKVANAFLGLLDEKQKKQVLHELDSQERREWTNLPARPNAGGLRLGDMNDDQIKAVCDLLANLLSPVGYEKIRLIMLADDQLLRGNQSRPGFGAENFSVVLFGTPSKSAPWAFQLDGHHLGLNVAVVGDAITFAPSFIGTQPVKYQLGGHDIRPLSLEVDLAFKFVNELTEDQFREALTSDQRGQIQTGPGNDGRLLNPQGIQWSSLNQQQQDTLLSLISAWIGNLPRDQSIRRWREIRPEMGQMYFAWSGSRKPGSDTSYVIQSPSLIIEFAYQDLGGNPLNHLHTQYRNPKNDYGALWFKESVAESGETIDSEPTKKND